MRSSRPAWREPGRLPDALLASLACAVFVAATMSGCTPSSGNHLEIRVTPSPTGARIVVDVHRAGGDRAWVGFGLGPGNGTGILDRVHEVRASGPEGNPLTTESIGAGAFRVDVGDLERWSLSYRLRLDEARGSTFYRTSGRSRDGLVLVGSDAWPRFYAHREDLLVPPSQRGLGADLPVTVSFEMDGQPESWTVITAAPPAGHHRFQLNGELHHSVFAVGPYRAARVTDGLAVAVHERWNVSRDRLVEMTRRLMEAMTASFGPPGQSSCVALFSPLPENLLPRRGMATAGMVRNRTLLLYAGLAPGASEDSARVHENLTLLIGHELFHLYVPWGLPMNAELSWFSEGWAMHVARQMAVHSGLLDGRAAHDRLAEAYRKYLGVGGHRAGSLPEASKSLDGPADLVYLRGELVFRLLAREWQEAGHREPFSSELWHRLRRTYDGGRPLNPGDIRAALVTMVRPATIRRYVEGTAPITPPELGLAYH